MTKLPYLLTRQQRIGWIVQYIVCEGFKTPHLEALIKIIGLFNDNDESEKEIFEFAESLYKKHAG